MVQLDPFSADASGSGLHPLRRFSGMPSVLHAYNFPSWKHPIVRQCFPGQELVFLGKGARVPQAAWVLVWGKMPLPPGIEDGAQILRMEDGFLRSVGLGADLVRPMSWVVDAGGIYYDATSASDLEKILATQKFDDGVRARAARLRSRIVKAGLTKYNVGDACWQRPLGVAKVILVPGQVESDASLAFGAPDERSNMGLLSKVRKANPDAYIVYKPHPDVLARLRKQGQGEQEAAQYCDEVVSNVAMGDLLSLVDEVHVLTSLAGFEALLRNKTVTCYGQPFYSGWGLTHDMIPCHRRERQLTLDELVAGVLILYPLYMSRDGRDLLTPELALDELQAWRQKSGGREPWWRGFARIFIRRIFGVR